MLQIVVSDTFLGSAVYISKILWLVLKGRNSKFYLASFGREDRRGPEKEMPSPHHSRTQDRSRAGT